MHMEAVVHNPIIVAQFTYGLSAVRQTPASLNESDAFQKRRFTYILKIEHPSYSKKEVSDTIKVICLSSYRY